MRKKFTVIKKDTALTLNYGALALLEHLIFSFQTDDGALHQLAPEAIATEGAKIHITFAAHELLTHSSLTFSTADNAVLLSCSLAIKRHPFYRNPALRGISSAVISARPTEAFKRWTAIYRHKDWWSRPAFSDTAEYVPDRTHVVYAELAGGEYLHALTLAEGDFASHLAGDDDAISLHLSSFAEGKSEMSAFAIAFAVASDPYKAADSVFAYATQTLQLPSYVEHKRRLPLNETLGWCSWDAFYHQVDEKGVLEKAAELTEKGVPVRWMLIDDGWLQQNEQRLTSLEEDREKFPSGFAELIHTLKREHGIQWVGVWHAFAGYWGGIDPASSLAKAMPNCFYTTANGAMVPNVIDEGARTFWDRWYGMLRSKGVDFVKVDGQSSVANHYLYDERATVMAQRAHAALDAAV
ncbi:MAG TPA: Sip1-related alpha-galactosidase, partial [Sphaerochaeta sp.]|nr:Sip1-related alpha-galactosidase [Sphaerochaeta sp.]